MDFGSLELHVAIELTYDTAKVKSGCAYDSTVHSHLAERQARLIHDGWAIHVNFEVQR